MIEMRRTSTPSARSSRTGRGIGIGDLAGQDFVTDEDDAVGLAIAPNG